MSEIRPSSAGDDAEQAGGPVAVSRPRGRLRLSLLGLLVAAAPVILDGFDVLQGPERALGAVIDRRASSPDASGRVWILRLNDGTLPALGLDDPFELWSRLLARATADGVERVVLLDAASFAPAAQAAAGRAPGGTALLLPSRVRLDPLFDEPTGVDRPLPDEKGERPFQEALLRLEPDVDGLWRRMPAQRTIRGSSMPTLAGALGGSGVIRPAFAKAGTLPSLPAASFVRGELGQAPWRGGSLVVCSDEALAAAAVWTPLGQPLSEPWAVAQLGDAIAARRLFRELPPLAASPFLLAIFLVSAFLLSRFAPLTGFLAAAGLALAALAVGIFLRGSLLWIVPLTPILPVAALGAAVGLLRRHRGLERGMAQAGVHLGQSRALHPLVRAFTLDGAVLRQTVDLLDLEGAALIDALRPDAPAAAATRGEQDAFVRRVRTEAPALLKGEPGTGALLRPLDGRFHLYLLPRDGALPEIWWESHRDVVERLGASLAFSVEAEPGAPEGLQLPPERRLEILRTTGARSEVERILLLRLLGRLPGGVLVSDLLGRTLLQNQVVDRLALPLRLAPETLLPGLLQKASGRDEAAVRRALLQVVRDRTPWSFYARVEIPEPRHYFMQLSPLDLGGGAAGVLPREVLVLAATDVTGLARMATARAKPEEQAAPALPAEAFATMNRMLDVLQSMLASGTPPGDEQLREMKEQLDALRTPVTTLTRKDVEAVEAVDLVAEIERAVAEAQPIATEVGISLLVKGDELVPMALARPEALRRAFSMLLRKGVSSWRRAPTLTFQAYSTGTEVIVQMSSEGSADPGTRRVGETRVTTDALSKAVEEAGGRLGHGDKGALRLAFPALVA